MSLNQVKIQLNKNISAEDHNMVYVLTVVRMNTLHILQKAIQEHN